MQIDIHIEMRSLMLDCHSALMSGIVDIYIFNSIQEQYMFWREDRDYLKQGILGKSWEQESRLDPISSRENVACTI
jgi:hypothetical protein